MREKKTNKKHISKKQLKKTFLALGGAKIKIFAKFQKVKRFQ
jgi:hypothetical protein